MHAVFQPRAVCLCAVQEMGLMATFIFGPRCGIQSKRVKICLLLLLLKIRELFIKVFSCGKSVFPSHVHLRCSCCSAL